MFQAKFNPAWVFGGLIVASLVSMPVQAQVLTVTNGDFELPGTAKTEFFDATGAIVTGIIPGWEPSGPGAANQTGGPVAGPGDSGVEQFGPAPATWSLYLASRDPSVYQTTANNIVSNRHYILTYQLRLNYLGGDATGLQNFQAGLYYLDANGTTRHSLGTINSTTTSANFIGQFLHLTDAQVAAGLGRPIGIEFDNITGAEVVGGVEAWFGLDNVNLIAAGGIGDVDANGTTNLADYQLIRQNMLSGLTGWTNGDLTGDGVINLLDFRQWTLDPAIAGSGLASIALGVPEPTTVFLALLAVVGFAGCGRWRIAGSAFSRSSLRTAATGGLLSLALGSVSQAQPIPLINSTFEANGTTKTEFFDATGAPVPNIIPGWVPAGNGVQGPGGPVAGPGDTGVEDDGFNGTTGFALYLAGLDPNVYQTSAHNIQANKNYRLTFDAKDAYTSTTNFTAFDNGGVMQAWLTYGASRTPLTVPTDLLLPNRAGTIPYQTFTLTVNSSTFPGAAIGQPIGIEFDNVSNDRDLVPAVDIVNSWIHIDNVQLSLVTVLGDANFDGQANVADYNIIRDNFRQTVALGTNGDISGPGGAPNGFVDLWDYGQWKENRTDLGSGSVESLGVPEPASWMLLFSAAMALAGAARRSPRRS